MAELLYKELTGQIRQAAFDVHSYFGNGFLEQVYENALAYKLRQIPLKWEVQKPLKVYFEENVIVGEYFADLIVEEKVIVELKVAKRIEKIHLAQLNNYLKATKHKLGLLINFGDEKLQMKRVIL